MRTVPLLLMVALVFALDLGAQQPRDNLRPAVTGNARIVGVVVADDDEARPLRRVRLVISGSELEGSRAAITDDDGVFAFERLPGGRYTLTASKDGYASMAFGALRSGRPGRPVVLATGEQRRADLRLPRGAVITGMLRDPQGDPAAGVTIVILSRRFSPATEERRLMAVPNTTTVTDDRGIYRVFGLPAGAYAVAALPRLTAAGNAGEIAVVSREEVQRALAEVQERRASPRPGIPAPSRPAVVSAERRATVSLAPTYYPGTTFDSRAVLIEVAAGEERRGVDFDVDYVPMATVAGFVTMPPGMRVQLTLTMADPSSPYQTATVASPGLDGRFTFRRVPPGHYAVHARAFPSGVRTGATPAESTFWATTEVIVSGEDLDGLAISLEPAVTLAGEIVFDSGTASAPVLEGFRIPLQIASRGTAFTPLPSALVDGPRVTLQGAVPGTYRFNAQPQGIRTRVGRWWLKSILIDGKEILDEAPVIPPAAKDLRVTFSDRASELSGVVTGTSGPVTDAFVVVFSAERTSWFLHSRRVAAVLLNSEGRYVVRNLPAGAYLVAISSDLESNEWFDPEALEVLRERATPVRIGENDVKTQDFRLP